jgi:hypothetical protein
MKGLPNDWENEPKETVRIEDLIRSIVIEQEALIDWN